MKVERTKYTAHYENGIVVAQWISVEMLLDGESPLDSLDRSKSLVEQWYKSNNLESPYGASQPPGPPPIIEVKPEDRAIEVTVEDIKSCQDLVTLDSYRIIIRGKTDLELAYVERRPQLVRIESQQLLDDANEYCKRKRKK